MLLNLACGSTPRLAVSVTKRLTTLLIPSAPSTTSASAAVPSAKWTVVVPDAPSARCVQRFLKCARGGVKVCDERVEKYRAVDASRERVLVAAVEEHFVVPGTAVIYEPAAHVVHAEGVVDSEGLQNVDRVTPQA